LPAHQSLHVGNLVFDRREEWSVTSSASHSWLLASCPTYTNTAGCSYRQITNEHLDPIGRQNLVQQLDNGFDAIFVWPQHSLLSR
jgi:hypothetical protein